MVGALDFPAAPAPTLGDGVAGKREPQVFEPDQPRRSKCCVRIQDGALRYVFCNISIRWRSQVDLGPGDFGVAASVIV